MIEYLILTNLLYSEDYARRVVPYLKEEYFSEVEQKQILKEIVSTFDKYNTLPSKDALKLSLSEMHTLTEDHFSNAIKLIDNMEYDSTLSIDWLVDKTEKFCQDKAIYNAVRHSILILDNKDKKLDKGSIPKLLSDALAVTFDTSVGHDFLDDYSDRYDFYHLKEDKIPFDLKHFNKITKDGFSKKSLSIIMSSTGVGKTMAMVHFAATNLMNGNNVLYITAEMAEERIAERIDANLLDIRLDDLGVLDKQTYESRVERLRKRTGGKLIIKEYPTASANVNHFRFLLNELKMKRNFIPDIIYIDYLNICASARMRLGSSVNSYTYIKSIAEEIRGLSIEFNVPIVSATQTNRGGANNTDVELTDTSESFGLPATADFMVALIKTDELEDLGQIMVKQLKNRWGDINSPNKFVVGINREKMKLFDVADSQQQNVSGGNASSKNDDVPVMDSTDFGRGMKAERFDKYSGFV